MYGVVVVVDYVVVVVDVVAVPFVHEDADVIVDVVVVVVLSVIQQ